MKAPTFRHRINAALGDPDATHIKTDAQVIERINALRSFAERMGFFSAAIGKDARKALGGPKKP